MSNHWKVKSTLNQIHHDESSDEKEEQRNFSLKINKEKSSPPSIRFNSKKKNETSRPPKHQEEHHGQVGIFSFGVFSFSGKRGYNEDVPKCVCPFSNDAFSAFFGMYDGHHGLNCSSFIAEKIPLVLEQNLLDGKMDVDPLNVLRDTYFEVDKLFLMHAKSKNYEDGSTAVSVLIKNGFVYVANTGDSRAIMSQGGENVIALSHDHKAIDPDEKEKVISRGGSVIGGRVQGRIAVSRSFGDMEFKDPETFDGKYLICEPDVQRFEITSESEFIILATDGLWDVMKNIDVVNFVREDIKNNIELNQMAENLVNEAFDLGSEDNISVIIIILDKKIRKLLMKQSKMYKKKFLQDPIKSKIKQKKPK